MKVTVRAKLPQHKDLYSLEEWQVLEANKEYKVDVPGIKVISNAFVTPQGLVLNNGRLVKGCAYNISGNFDANYKFEFWKLAIEQYVVSTYGRSLKKKKLTEESGYFIIHTKWFNYFFWVTDALARLQRCIDAGYNKTHKLLIPRQLMSIGFVKESLKIFPVDFHIYDSNDFLSVRDMILPETRQWSSSLFPPHILRIRQQICDSARMYKSIQDAPKKIYVTRRNKGKRDIINEQEVIEYLVDEGFAIVDFEDYNFWDQVYLAMQSKTFISMHGAGITNAMFMPIGGVVIEIFNKDFFHYNHRFPYWKLCSCVGIKHYPLIEQPVESSAEYTSKTKKTDKIAAFRDKSVRVNIEKLRNTLNHISES